MPLTLPESLRIFSVLDLCRLEVGQSYIGTWGMFGVGINTSTLAAAYACALAVFLCSLGLICSSISARAWLQALRMSVKHLRGQPLPL
ncbi:hypothetical protein D3C73_1497990 [compost metagenome]